jgi:valyl-tRNA synthetase
VVADRASLAGDAGAGSLAVVAGDLEALVILAGGGAAPDADRARLEKELAEAEGFLVAARARLANEAFTSKAPSVVVAGARAREAELADQVERLRARLG